MTQSNKVFTDLPPFTWKELDGKVLEIKLGREAVSNDRNLVVVVGVDKVNNRAYILSEFYEDRKEDQ